MRGTRIFAVAFSAMLAVGLLVMTNSASAVTEAIVCHATGSATNPFNLLVLDASSTQFQGHLSHEEDIIAENPTPEQIAEAKAIKEGESDLTPLEFCLSLTTTTTTTSTTTTTTTTTLPTTTTTTTTLPGVPPTPPPPAPPAPPVPGEVPFTG